MRRIFLIPFFLVACGSNSKRQTASDVNMGVYPTGQMQLSANQTAVLQIGANLTLLKTGEKGGSGYYQLVLKREPGLDDSNSEFYTDKSTCYVQTIVPGTHIPLGKTITLRAQEILADLTTNGLQFLEPASGLTYKIGCFKTLDTNARVTVTPSPELLRVLSKERILMITGSILETK